MFIYFIENILGNVVIFILFQFCSKSILEQVKGMINTYL